MRFRNRSKTNAARRSLSGALWHILQIQLCIKSMVYLPCHLNFPSRSRCRIRPMTTLPLLILLADAFSGAENLDRAMAKNRVNEDQLQGKISSAAGIGRLGSTNTCDLKPNNLAILVKYDNYTQSVIFLCKCSSSLPLHRTSGALPECLEALRSAEAPSRALGRFCSLVSPSGATDCQLLKPALQPRLSSGCRQR